MPADLKASVETLQKDVAALAPKLTLPAVGGRGFGGGGGRGGGAGDSLVARVGQAKTGLMGGMWPTEITMRAYTESKAQLPKAIADANVALRSRGDAQQRADEAQLDADGTRPIK